MQVEHYSCSARVRGRRQRGQVYLDSRTHNRRSRGSMASGHRSSTYSWPRRPRRSAASFLSTDVGLAPRPPAFTRERGVKAVRIAWHWHSGKGCPVYEFAATRTIHGERHREQLRQTVNEVIASVIENPVAARRIRGTCPAA